MAWATGSDLDKRLRRELAVGSVRAMAARVVDGRLLVAVLTDHSHAPVNVRVWDLLSGDSMPLPAGEVECLTLATPMLFPRTPAGLAVTAEGSLAVAVGNDVAVVHPPVRP